MPSETKHHHYLPLTDPLAFHRRLRSRKRVVKSFEARANANRTFSEKAADLLTKNLGSTTFLILNAFWFLGWITINLGLIPGITPFDPFPFGLLTMTVSLEAIFLAIIVLISQNRAETIDDLREETELHINTIAEEEITKILELQILLLKKSGVDTSRDIELAEMLEPTDPEKIELLLEKEAQAA